MNPNTTCQGKITSFLKVKAKKGDKKAQETLFTLLDHYTGQQDVILWLQRNQDNALVKDLALRMFTALQRPCNIVPCAYELDPQPSEPVNAAWRGSLLQTIQSEAEVEDEQEEDTRIPDLLGISEQIIKETEIASDERMNLLVSTETALCRLYYQKYLRARKNYKKEEYFSNTVEHLRRAFFLQPEQTWTHFMLDHITNTAFSKLARTVAATIGYPRALERSFADTSFRRMLNDRAQESGLSYNNDEESKRKHAISLALYYYKYEDALQELETLCSNNHEFKRDRFKDREEHAHFLGRVTCDLAYCHYQCYKRSGDTFHKTKAQSYYATSAINYENKTALLTIYQNSDFENIYKEYCSFNKIEKLPAPEISLSELRKSTDSQLCWECYLTFEDPEAKEAAMKRALELEYPEALYQRACELINSSNSNDSLQARHYLKSAILQGHQPSLHKLIACYVTTDDTYEHLQERSNAYACLTLSTEARPEHYVTLAQEFLKDHESMPVDLKQLYDRESFLNNYSTFVVKAIVHGAPHAETMPLFLNGHSLRQVEVLEIHLHKLDLQSTLTETLYVRLYLAYNMQREHDLFALIREAFNPGEEPNVVPRQEYLNRVKTVIYFMEAMCLKLQLQPQPRRLFPEQIYDYVLEHYAQQIQEPEMQLDPYALPCALNCYCLMSILYDLAKPEHTEKYRNYELLEPKHVLQQLHKLDHIENFAVKRRNRMYKGTPLFLSLYNTQEPA